MKSAGFLNLRQALLLAASLRKALPLSNTGLRSGRRNPRHKNPGAHENPRLFLNIVKKFYRRPQGFMQDVIYTGKKYHEKNVPTPGNARPDGRRCQRPTSAGIRR